MEYTEGQITEVDTLGYKQNPKAKALCASPKGQDVAPDHFECIVQYLFGHFTWAFTTMEAACSQIETANRYELKTLYDDLFEKLTQLVIRRRVVFNNCVACRAWVLFKTLDKNNMLAEAARDYILKNAAEILRGDAFLDISENDLLDILKDDNLAVKSELDVYKALIKWGAHNLKTRKQKCIPDNFRRILTPLIPAVRFPNMAQSEFGWWNGSKGIEFRKQPRRYLKTIKDKRTVETPDDDQLKLEKAEAEQFSICRKVIAVQLEFPETSVGTFTPSTEGGSRSNVESRSGYYFPSEEFVCRVVLRNKTSAELTNPSHFFHSTACRECCPKPWKIPQNTTETFGFVCQKNQVAGLFSYQIRDKSFLVKYCAKNGYNDFVIGFAPQNISLNVNLLTEIDVADWSADIGRRKSVVWAKDITKTRNATVEMGELRVVAAMTTGPNVVLSIVLEND
ncbi:unnamed protein product [Allacma fusca]|uniref:BACK domain-containing protein n=1 Tax=Allacma fusca TaxID=39272 RepID=A0A8J2J3C5_9HEXA|nr:unnamed protein product [Allacma fusca]